MARLPASERRSQLLDVAADLFATQGYARTTTSQLAKAAGVSEPIIYRHFGSKRDLFVELIERTGARTLTMWSDALEGASTPEERLNRLLGANVMVTDENGRAAYRVLMQAITEVEDAAIRRAIDTHFHQLQSFLAREIDETRTLDSHFDSELLGWVLISVALGYGVLHALRVSNHGEDIGGQRVQDVVRSALLSNLGVLPTDAEADFA